MSTISRMVRIAIRAAGIVFFLAFYIGVMVMMFKQSLLMGIFSIPTGGFIFLTLVAKSVDEIKHLAHDEPIPEIEPGPPPDWL